MGLIKSKTSTLKSASSDNQNADFFFKLLRVFSLGLWE